MSNIIKKLLDSTREDEAIALINEYAEQRGLPDLSYIIVANALLRLYRDRVLAVMEEIRSKPIIQKDGGLQ